MNDDRQHFTLEGDDVKRPLFSRATGGLDFQRLFEQAIPMVAVGVLVAFANAKVTEYQVGEISKQMDRTIAESHNMQMQMASQAIVSASQQERLTGIAAQMTTYIGQQTAINTSIDSRLTFIERKQ